MTDTAQDTTIRPGDRVWVRGADPNIYEVREVLPGHPGVNMEAIALFVGGGFWRVSGLEKVPADA